MEHNDMLEWLASPAGSDLTHALIIFLLAVATYLTWRTHQDGAGKK